MSIKTCQICGGLYATETGELFAGKSCKCPPNAKRTPMPNDTERMKDAMKECMQALQCLYIAVEESTADNVRDKVLNVINRQSEEIQKLRFLNDELKQRLAWIKTNNDEEPEFGERVLVQTTSKMVMIADLSPNGWRTHETGWKEYIHGGRREYEYLSREQVTHWMPLPGVVYD